jgi:hypothetical protein
MQSGNSWNKVRPAVGDVKEREHAAIMVLFSDKMYCGPETKYIHSKN